MAQPCATNLHVRPAQKSDIPTMAQLGQNAFRGRPLNEALFPARLRRTDAPDAEEVAFRTGRHEKRFDSEGHHYIVAVDSSSGDKDGTIVGVACWQSCNEEPPPVEVTREQRMAELPAGLDFEALEAIEAAIKVLDKDLRDALGDEGYRNSWSLEFIAVDPAHQRRGIGKMLMEWGQERAAEEHKNIRFLASTTGAKMYLALGYQEVGALEVLGGMEYAFIKRAESTSSLGTEAPRILH